MAVFRKTKCFNVVLTCFLVSLSAKVFAERKRPAVVRTQHGIIHGTVNTVSFDDEDYQVRTFLGIPYAEPPVGDLRLSKPVPISMSKNSRIDAVSFGPACPALLFVPNIPQSEDCLTLNIYTPSTPVRTCAAMLRDLPVMVWIHGGAFLTETSRYYDGSYLSAYTEVIVVTMNYRLGPLGFFSFENDVAPGNYGLWDQQLAIKWVRDNIVYFGGDPEKITIFGESAGGSSVIYQMAYAGNTGLFNRAIAESGTVNTWSVGINGDLSRSAKQFSERLGCNQPSDEDILTCLRSIPSDVMTTAAQNELLVAPYDQLHLAWVPVYDNSFITSDTLTLLESIATSPDQFPVFFNTDLMIGTNNYDGVLYFDMYLPLINATSVVDFRVTPDEFKDICAPRLAEMVLKRPVSSQIVQDILDVYSSWDDPTNNTLRIDELARMTTDGSVRFQTVLTAYAHTGGNTKTYLYEFAAASAFKLFPFPAVLDGPYSTTHAEEIMFVFGGHEDIPSSTIAQKKLTKTVMTMWSNFAMTGDPNSPFSIGDEYQGVAWQAYTEPTQEYLLISPTMTPESAEKSHLSDEEVAFWNDLFLSTTAAGQ